MFDRKDWIVGVASIIVAVVILLDAKQLVGLRSLDPAGPAALPSIVAWGILLIGICHLVGAWLARKEPENAEKKGFLSEYKSVMQIVLICAVYNLVLEDLGYLLSTPLLIIGIMRVFGVRSIKSLLKTGILTTVTLFAVFHYALSIKLPAGILENIIK